MAAAKAAPSERAPSLQWEEGWARGFGATRTVLLWLQVLEKEASGANVLESGGQPQWEERIWARTLGALRDSVAAELRLAGEERAMVRRAALRRLLRRERLQQQQELRRLGKAFYVERL
ncbi:cilia- and flagella-associated protein 141 [Struthio camelus]|uniref:cilia- and flagella-associated protein 141 n=1 Tax=Struthio camelus TaxID=8801 RepID=UPI003603C0F0